LGVLAGKTQETVPGGEYLKKKKVRKGLERSKKNQKRQGEGEEVGDPPQTLKREEKRGEKNKKGEERDRNPEPQRLNCWRKKGKKKDHQRSGGTKAAKKNMSKEKKGGVRKK